MTLRIHVIGLGRQQPPEAFDELLSSGPIVARDRELAADWLSTGYPITESFDAYFDDLRPADIAPAIVERFGEIASDSGNCVYLVPESALLGDSTVAALTPAFDLSLIPGSFTQIGSVASIQIIDALDLAVAEGEYPFDSGRALLDGSRPALITNLRGNAVVPAAGRRIARFFGETNLDAGESRALLLLPSVDYGPVRSFEGLQRIVAMLRSPTGCPWDREQTVETLIPMMLEEIDEFREALCSKPAGEQADELGDVLLHILFIAQIAREQADGFSIEDVLEASSSKMVRRHPHVFGDAEISSIEDVYEIWQRVKNTERASRRVSQSIEG